jgi:integrase
MQALADWLRAQGMEERKYLHTLRKEFGSLVAQEHGIYAASRALRHSDIQVTAKHYLDKKQRISIGLGRLLAPENVIEFKAATAKPAATTDKRKA